MKFIFKARSKSGELKEGTIEAVSSDAAVEVLQKNDLFTISIKAEKDRQAIEKTFLKYWDRVSSKELMIFFRQLSILIEAKVPIVASLLAVKDQTINVYFQKIIEEMVNDVQDGLPLSDALQKHRNVFSTLAVNIVRAGEVSGNLKKSVEYVANNIEKTYSLNSKVKSAMMYPIVVLIVFFVIAFIVISFIVPKLTVMITSISATVPWYTQVVITTSDFMSRYWWAVAVLSFGFIGGAAYYLKTEDGKREWDQIKLRLPIFGPVFQYVYLARFADNLAVLLAGGIPIIKALNVVSSVINNTVYEAVILRAADEVKIGGNMSDAFRKSPDVPPIVSQMIKIGEESGQVDIVLGHIANFYEQESAEITKNLATLIEPVLMVIIGVAVGFLAFSVIMPIYNLAGQL